MELDHFADLCGLTEATELDRFRLLAFYLYTQKDVIEFALSDLTALLPSLHLPTPNVSRLRSKVKSSSGFISGKAKDSYKLHRREIKYLQNEYPQLATRSEVVISDDTILPSILVQDTRGFIESVARQINASYQFNIFDGCAVLMRRLVEIVLILAFEKLGRSELIKNEDDTYITLDRIIAEAKKSKEMSLSKDTKRTIDAFRELGNLSAHKIYYNARRNDIDQIKLSYRASIEELLYKSGLRS